MDSAQPDPSTLLPPSFAAVAPVLDEVIERWHGAEPGLGSWMEVVATLPPREPEGWARLVEHLQLINTFQWHEEDRSRARGAGDTVLAGVKRSIDDSNRRRVQAVDRLDAVIHAGYSALGVIDPGAPLNSESPGSIIDRLSVLSLKAWHAAEAVVEATPNERRAMQDRLAMLREQQRDLGGCLDDLLLGIRQGRVGLKLYRQIKLYRDAETGRLVADLD
ncbi:MAG: DUF4254 domain-containing protein [bacterium]|nr:DUF4254 domain-containing protein [bacterium]MBK7045151.1 DUF4254 domain-containing protein [bacterium]MBK7189412.1 DUF4254 domain-containing protein [bacterium]MBK7769792.1 DUF4254 domain-containing protein [bacterium]MBK9775926.1 DUF4254 domain-containing protein [bacterium]